MVVQIDKLVVNGASVIESPLRMTVAEHSGGVRAIPVAPYILDYGSCLESTGAYVTEETKFNFLYAEAYVELRTVRVAKGLKILARPHRISSVSLRNVVAARELYGDMPSPQVDVYGSDWTEVATFSGREDLAEQEFLLLRYDLQPAPWSLWRTRFVCLKTSSGD